jgi:hypothetical protein
MKRSLLAAAMVVVGLCYGQLSAKADAIIWTLSSNVPLSDGGTLNGYFGINSYGYVNGNAFDLTTAGGTTNFDQNYNATINASDPNILTVDFFAPDPAYSSSLTLEFEYSLLVPIADNPIVGGNGGPSFECEGYSCTEADIRYVDGGFASATPIPATLPLFAGGLGFVGYLAKRRKQNGEQARAVA